jgi:hypothetical protein
MVRDAAKIILSGEMAVLAGEGAKSLSYFTVALLPGPPPSFVLLRCQQLTSGREIYDPKVGKNGALF